MSRLQNAIVGGARAVLGVVPSSWLPGGSPDPLIERRAALGTQTARVDGPAKVRGAARFAAEVPMEGLLHAALVHSTIARGRISELDTEAAEAAPGVAAVMTWRNAPRMETPKALSLTATKAAGNNILPILQDPEIRWNGQTVAVVLAETREEAEYAASLVRVTYDAEPARTRFEEAKAHARTPSSILIEPNHVRVGDAEAAYAAAPYKVDVTYTTPPHNHNAIELHGVTAAWQGDRLHVHDATQMISATATTLAQVFGLPEASVRVSSPFVGGGFGGKALWDHQILAAAAARLTGRPVRLMLSREGVYRLVGGRPPSEQRVRLAADGVGRLKALMHSGYSVKPLHSVSDEQYTFASRGLYAAETFDIVQHHLDLDVVANTFMRAPGESIGTFALESAIDELAHAIGMDPVELRLRNQPERHPLRGSEHSQRATALAFQRGAEAFGWERRDPVPRSRREGEWLVGLGCAGGTYPYMRFGGGQARVTLLDDGRAVVESAAHEMGMGTVTAQRQHAADRLGLPLEAVSVEIGDSDLPFAMFAGGSAQTASIASAIMAACDMLAGELLKLAGNDTPLAGLSAEEVEFAEGALRSRADPARQESFTSILERAGRKYLRVIGEAPQPLEMLKYAMDSTSAVFCEVRVSAVTGEVRVARLLGSFDCGRILNPKTATSQFKGGMIMGLGLALMEETIFDERKGRIMGATLADYHVPAHLDVPDIEVMWTDIPDPRAPLGARGIGEIGITGVGAAVANAVYNATGIRARDLPLTPDKLIG